MIFRSVPSMLYPVHFRIQLFYFLPYVVFTIDSGREKWIP